MKVGKALRVLVGASVVVALGLMVAPRRMDAQDPVPLKKKGDEPALPAQVFVTAGKPPAPADIDIPDDPPPHEGAMFSLPNRIAAPDIIQIEVLEALPGRPISGERLVRPDGTITLGFYGDIKVSGLTTAQVKERVIIRLRSFLPDESLGLIAEMDDGQPKGEPRPEAPPADLPLPPETPKLPPEPGELLPPEPDPRPVAKPKKTAIVAKPSPGRTRLAAMRQQDDFKPPGQQPDPARAEVSGENPVARPAFGDPVARETPGGDEWEESLKQMPFMTSTSPRSIRVHPRDSDRVSVEVASYNSRVYFVLGEVNAPGRLPWTGNETVLDALQFAGGLDPNSNASNVQLARPSRGKKPAKVHQIDLKAIYNGDAKSNLQIFPGDRLVVGRAAAADSTIKLNADAARTNTLLNSALTYAFVLRNFDRLGEVGGANSSSELSIKLNGQTFKITLGDDAPRVDPARRKAALKAFQEYWSKTSRAGGAEEARLMEEMMKLLDK